VNLRGCDPEPADPYGVLRRLLRATGVDGSAIPQDRDELEELFRTRTAGRRLLILLDNAAGDAQVRPLLPGSPSCTVLITSRARLSGLDGAQLLNLDVFEPDQAVGLIEAIVGRDRVALEPAAAREIARSCGHLPLAVRVAAARLAGRPHWSLARLATRLADERRRLDELVFGDLEVRASVALGYQGLTEQQRRAFRLLGLLKVAEFPAWVLGPLLDVPVGEAEDLTEALIDAQLLDVAGLDQVGQVRLRFHDLIVLYARERLAEDPAEQRTAALARLSEAWLLLVAVADRRAHSRDSRGWTSSLDRSGGDSGLTPTEIDAIVTDPLLWYDSERVGLGDLPPHGGVPGIARPL
jgi:hypothetical protein